jgi:hypothetical protein
MATAIHLSLAEHLNTVYEPDCEYLDGMVEERIPLQEVLPEA